MQTVTNENPPQQPLQSEFKNLYPIMPHDCGKFNGQKGISAIASE